MTAALLAVTDLCVHYQATTALDGVDLEVHAGEVHAVVGENGAGKSTLLRAAAGAVRPAAGCIRARAARLAWVPQEALLPAELTVAEWIFLGAELRRRSGWLLQRAMREAANAALHQLACTAPAEARIRSLPWSQRKQVQLARAFRDEPDLLLLDEPTAVLAHTEAAALFAGVRRLKRQGTGILYVSHRLDEVLAIADRVTVLRDGRRVSTDAVGAVNASLLVQRMVGREVAAAQPRGAALGDRLLSIVDLATAHVRGLSLDVAAGEIVGLAGLVGAGRSEVLESIAGLRPLHAGRIACAAPPVFVPEDRAGKGLIPALGLRENVCLPAEGWFIRPSRERAVAREWMQRLAIRASDCEAAVDSLSGGNQQKLLLARALRQQPRLLLVDEPTAGVDVGAKAEIHEVMRRLAADGTAIVIASSELPELLHLCDRIVALRAGAVAGVVSAGDANEEVLAALITGAGDQDATL